MTFDENSSDTAFRGLMKNLNLDESQFKSYKTNFSQLTYDQLSTTKNEIESQLSLLFDILANQYKADMATPLLTDDGYPRNDIDVVGIRLIRVKIIRLRNDVKLVYTLLETKLIEKFEQQKGSAVSESPPEPEQTIPTPVYTIPFATVCEVVPLGPASASGLKEGDQIIAMDDIHAANHNRLANISLKVRDSVDKSLAVVISREGTRQTLELKPTDKWDGRGLLGCRLLPL
ncbi:DEHA2B15444p [Debaryomyces hansenii CBS767]|jgi:26S proteasome non-ATPase regulatory subunit 9|uniref:Probable 26S proteasome regulatory subunit p27 n=1 Tax=Debaryomyces hansenii (strain ATCC 36239 / CBS 767 / BCRC 21394 / JCM 1990 / NBRC 0083 / IGC 2968) TaxID=284592 RepID=Q6BVZ8_DEBHA|nr:DEHA2B15444p [Debaryomyces hansenii CBS767]CAG85635.1 DEHA2B15444p [Debaryomyces hansenii CBS767]|eukprot:XP_457621.1 DEHA2B15444p [Debaryomyces hansenii CBS767]